MARESSAAVVVCEIVSSASLGDHPSTRTSLALFPSYGNRQPKTINTSRIIGLTSRLMSLKEPAPVRWWSTCAFFCHFQHLRSRLHTQLDPARPINTKTKKSRCREIHKTTRHQPITTSFFDHSHRFSFGTTCSRIKNDPTNGTRDNLFGNGAAQTIAFSSGGGTFSTPSCANMPGRATSFTTG